MPTPGSGTLTPASGALNYDSAVFAASNASSTSSTGGVGPGLACQDPVLPCDDFALTVTLPVGYESAHPKDMVKITISWADATGKIDFDTYMLHPDGTEAARGASSNNPEVMMVAAIGGTTKYTIRTVPYTASGSSYHGKVELVLNTAGPSSVVVPASPNPQPGDPRFHVYFPGLGQGQNGSGEFNVGYNPFSHNIMSFASSRTYRTTLPQYLIPSLPESCAALWTDVTPTSTSTGLDPILFTDRSSGRTLASNFTGGANALYARSDDDGANWTQVGASPPNAGADHQTLATGPYPADAASQGFAAAAGAVESTQPHYTKPYATYYCSQDVVGPATCQRSDNGGDSFGPGVAIYDGTTTLCGGLHGHAHVSYVDGAVYVPVPNCSGMVGGTVSLDSGMTWTNFQLPGTTNMASDPSIAIDAANTVYECYTNGQDGDAFVQVSNDHGKTWGKTFDIGKVFGVVNSVFPHMEAGKAGRAACAFIGTTKPGNHQAADFPGIWYPYMATTFDGGVSWVTVNLSPNDPVQGVGGIWNQGGGPQNRNLLDFNEGTQDEHGRFIFGYDDGCIGDCINNPSTNSFTAESRLAVQSGGRTLWEDVAEPAAPAASCLAGSRTKMEADLTWAIPDNGGAPIGNYKIYRGTAASGPFTYIGQTNSNKNAYVDATADPTVSTYYYRVTAFNSGVPTEGKVSNVVPLPIVASKAPETSCVLPGITLLTDPSGDSTGGVSQTDVVGLLAAEPQTNPDKIVFTMDIASLNPVLPGVYYIILTKNTAGDQLYLLADTSTGSFQFTYGTYSDPSGQGVLAFNQIGTLDAASTTNATLGTITYVVPRTIFGTLAKVGGVIPVDVRIRQGSPAATSRDSAGPATYTVRGTDICSKAQSPIGGGSDGSSGGPNAPSSSTGSASSDGRFAGGALGLGLMLPLLGLGSVRRKRTRKQA